MDITAKSQSTFSLTCHMAVIYRELSDVYCRLPGASTGPKDAKMIYLFGNKEFNLDSCLLLLPCNNTAFNLEAGREVELVKITK